MIRKNSYTIDQILPLIGSSDRISLDGDLVKMRTLRLLNFKVHGITCVTCGLEGKFFATEKSHKRDKFYHVNLYAVREDGTEVLMTQDHITALSLGGPNTLENLQTMCSPCNCKKGNGRTNVGYKTLDMSHLLRTSYVPLKKNVARLAAAIKDGTATMEHLNLLILALNRTTCNDIHTVARKSLPLERSIEEVDEYSDQFIPVGERAVIAHKEGSRNFYIYDRVSGDRLAVSFKRDPGKSHYKRHQKKK